MVSSVLILSKESAPKVSKKEMVNNGISDLTTFRKPTFNYSRLDEMEVLFLPSEHLERGQVYGTRGSLSILFITRQSSRGVILPLLPKVKMPLEPVVGLK